MLTLALIVATCMFLLVAIHPFIIYPLTLGVLTRRQRVNTVMPATPAAEVPAAGAAPPPRLAVCVCAYNEEAVIEQKMENMMALRAGLGGDLDVLVHVDCSNDRTAELLEPWRDRIQLIVSPARAGKTVGMNRLVAMTQADIIVFTDANVMIDAEALPALAEAFLDPDVGCVCGHLIYTNPDGSPTAAMGSLYWRLEEKIKAQEGRLGAVMGADGSIFAIRRVLHRPVPDHVIDDMYLSLSILLDGWKIVRSDRAVAYEASVTASDEEFRRKVRIGCQAFNVHRMLWKRMRRMPALQLYMYGSHKFLRWLAIYHLAAAAAFGTGAMIALGVPALWIAGLWLLAVAIGWIGVRRRVFPIVQIVEILRALSGAGLGVMRSFAGDRFTTWTPAASIRRD